MKFTLIKLAMAMVAILFFWSPKPASAQNIVRQTILLPGADSDDYEPEFDADDGEGPQMHIVTSADSGTTTTMMPLEANDSSFELFAYGSAWDNDKLYFLDRKVIGSFLGDASIVIETGDAFHEWFNPDNPPRTRADKPYQLAISVSGMSTDSSKPLYAREVLYSHVGQNYDVTYTPNDNLEYVITSMQIGNLAPSYTPVYTLLTPMAPTKAMGIETFTVSSLSENVSEKGESIMAQEMLVVWPVSEASINGVTDGMTIRDSLPNITAEYKDLYPLSYTYIQIYPGPPVLGREGDDVEVFGSSIRWHNTSVPQNEIVSIENWEDMIPLEGDYTVEVISVTPFDDWAPERLAFTNFTVNRKVRVNGQVITSEK